MKIKNGNKCDTMEKEKQNISKVMNLLRRRVNVKNFW